MIEQFHASPSTNVSAAFGTTFTFVDETCAMGIVPVVGIRTTCGSYTNVSTISDPALVRKLIDELSVALSALEASRG